MTSSYLFRPRSFPCEWWALSLPCLITPKLDYARFGGPRWEVDFDARRKTEGLFIAANKSFGFNNPSVILVYTRMTPPFTQGRLIFTFDFNY